MVYAACGGLGVGLRLGLGLEKKGLTWAVCMQQIGLGVGLGLGLGLGLEKRGLTRFARRRSARLACASCRGKMCRMVPG